MKVRIRMHPMLARAVVAGLLAATNADHRRTFIKKVVNTRTRNVYRPGGGDQERARRRRQIEKGMIRITDQ